MNHIDIIDEHSIIRETVGYEVLNQVPIEDMPKVMEFLKIVYNYNRMKRVVKEDEEPGWVDPMTEMLDREEKESEWQRRRRLDVMKKKALEEEKEKTEHLPVSGPDLSKYHGKSPPAESWMDQYYYEYTLLRASGMMFEFHPEWTGIWDKDKYAFCHDRKYKKK